VKIDSAEAERVLAGWDGPLTLTRLRGAPGFGPMSQ
jgi:hypothetical protein